MKIGLYAGSFDPVTRGHLAVIDQSLSVVDILHVVVSKNIDKKYLFSVEEREDLLKSSIKEDILSCYHDQIVIESVSNILTVNYARAVNASILIRGIRNGADYAYERSVAVINKKLAPEIETIFLPTPVEYEEISSSTVKGLMKFNGGDIAASDFVTPCVLQALRNKISD
jgi:pantetheine-phosphate adenylyltransferase